MTSEIERILMLYYCRLCYYVETISVGYISRKVEPTNMAKNAKNINASNFSITARRMLIGIITTAFVLLVANQTGNAVKAAANYAAPLPNQISLAQGFGSGNAGHVLISQEWDLAKMKEVFNTINIAPGNQALVQKARAAGLAVILEFDYKTDFMNEVSINNRVNAVIAQIKNNPGTISGVHVADRLNEQYSAEQGKAYLAATGGRLHAEVPGVPVFVDVSDWELTCGKELQPSCSSVTLNTKYPYEKNSVLTSFKDSGYIDGFFIGDNLQKNNANANYEAWKTARALWPAPFKVMSRASQFAFATGTYTGTQSDANAIANAYILSPMAAKADGISAWSWKQEYQGSVSTLLNKDGSNNYIWEAMKTSIAASFLPKTSAPVVRVTSPSSGSIISGVITISAEASDDNAIDHVSFSVNDQYIGSSSTYPYSVNWNSLLKSNGDRYITAKAYDKDGNITKSDAMLVKIAN